MRAFLIRIFFPGSLEEYDEAKRLHIEEMRKYRKRWHFILGLVLLGVPGVAAIISDAVGWSVKIGALLMVCGFIFVMDTITQHYCLKLIRREKELKGEPNQAVDPTPENAPRDSGGSSEG